MKIVKGPPIKVLQLPGGAKYSVQHKAARVVKHAGVSDYAGAARYNPR